MNVKKQPLNQDPKLNHKEEFDDYVLVFNKPKENNVSNTIPIPQSK